MDKQSSPSTSKKPVASVIIPCFNMGRYLDDALDSIRAQTFADYEVIIVDDGSTEKDTLEKLKTIRDVVVIRQENMGLPAARNSGVRAAKGEFVTCLDADDVLRPRFLEACVTELNNLRAQNAGFVGVYTKLFEGRDTLWKPLEHDPVALLRTNFFHSATMFRKSAWKAVGGYDETMRKGYEDWNFWIALVESGYTWALVHEELTGYRIRENSMVVNSNKLHGELYAKIVDNHPIIFDRYGKELIKILMSAVAEKDMLLENRVEMVTILETHIQDLKQRVDDLTVELLGAGDELAHYRSQRVFRWAQRLRLIRDINKG